MSTSNPGCHAVSFAVLVAVSSAFASTTTAAPESAMNVVVNVEPVRPFAGTTLASCMTPMMQTLGEPDWSMAGMQGVMGHAFQFAMKEGGGPVMHDQIDWGIAFSLVKKLAGSRAYNTNKHKTDVDRSAVEREARDAVLETLDRGIPALVWQPMTLEMKANRQFAFCWGLIVGYNEQNETYTVRHPARPETYTVRYDDIGHSDGAEWFHIRIFEEPKPEVRTLHVNALRNAVQFANGVRYSDGNFIQKNGKPTAPYGFAAYSLWQKAFESADIPLEPSRWHSEIIRARRLAAAQYVRELATALPEAAGPLEAAAKHYDREMKSLQPLYELCTETRKREAITAEERAKAGRLIGEALKADRDAVAQIEVALEILDGT